MMLDGIINRRLTAALIWLTLAAGVIYVFIFEPGKSGFFPVCPFRALTGFTCPGCGTTRGLHKLFHGDVIGAFQLNPLMLVLLPILLYVLIRYTSATMRGHSLNMNRLDAKYIWVLFAVVLSFWILRNTPFYPFVS
jgi:Protein of unknown function (DUF2752)